MITAFLVLLGDLTVRQKEAVAELRRLGADVRIENIAPSPTEIWVDYRGNETQDSSLVPIAGLEPLTALRILGGKVTDRGLLRITRVPRLWLLVVRSSQVKDPGVETISKLGTLTKLDLIEVKVTRQGLEYLSRLKKLERLFLYGTTLRDGDVDPLKKLSWLSQLSLPKSISAAKVEELRQALPKTDVGRD